MASYGGAAEGVRACRLYFIAGVQTNPRSQGRPHRRDWDAPSGFIACLWYCVSRSPLLHAAFGLGAQEIRVQEHECDSDLHLKLLPVSGPLHLNNGAEPGQSVGILI